MEVQEHYEPLTTKHVKKFKKLQPGKDLYVMIDHEVIVSKEGYPVVHTESKKMPELNESVEGFYIKKETGDSIIPILMTEETYNKYLNGKIPSPNL